MNIEDLVLRYRYESKDMADPPFLEDSFVVDLYNDAEAEACKRKRLIFDKTTDGICIVNLTSGEDTGILHGSINEIHRAYLVNSYSSHTYLTISTRDELDFEWPGWRESTEIPQYLLVDELTFQVVPPPTEDATLKLEVYRGPISPMVLPGSSPEIDESHHRYLYHWVLAKAFDMPESDFYDPRLAEKHNQHFIDYFGPPVNANWLKKMRENMPSRDVW